MACNKLDSAARHKLVLMVRASHITDAGVGAGLILRAVRGRGRGARIAPTPAHCMAGRVRISHFTYAWVGGLGKSHCHRCVGEGWGQVTRTKTGTWTGPMPGPGPGQDQDQGQGQDQDRDLDRANARAMTKGSQNRLQGRVWQRRQADCCSSPRPLRE